MAKRNFNKVNKVNFNGTNQFFEAIEKQDTDLVHEMILNGADVHGRTTGRSLLSVLMVEIPYGERSTPLHVASLLGCDDIVRLLLTYDADVNAKNDDGMTSLDYALSSYAYYQTETEKKKTSKLSSRSSLEKAEEKTKGYEDIIRQLIAHGGRPGLFALPEKFSHPRQEPPARPTAFLP